MEKEQPEDTEETKTPLSDDSQHYATPKASESSSKDLEDEEDDESKETSSKSTERNLNTIAERHEKSVVLVSSNDPLQEGEMSPESISYIKVSSGAGDPYKDFPNAVKLS